MGVELPQLLNVLAHELRGPLSVIQGYLRLMIRQRVEPSPDLPMLQAMLDASGKLSVLAKQASEIGVLAGEPPPRDTQVTVSELLTTMAARAEQPRIVLETSALQANETIMASDGDALALALTTLAASVARNADVSEVLVTTSPGNNAGVTVTLRAATIPGRAADETVGAMTYDQGGFGLALILASLVLHAHGAQATIRRPSGTIDVAFQQGGGAR